MSLACDDRGVEPFGADVVVIGGGIVGTSAAAFLAEVLRRSTPGRLRQVVQLHLSRECNRPALAAAAARAVLTGQIAPPEILTAHQDRPLSPLAVGAEGARKRPRVRRSGPRPGPRQKAAAHPWLPGLE